MHNLSHYFMDRPPCYMANSDLSIPTTPWLVDGMTKRMLEMYILQLIFMKVRKSGVSSYITDRDLSQYSIFGHILFAHAIYVHFITNLHIGRMQACVMFKNLLNKEINAFDPRYNGLVIRGPEIVSANQRYSLFYNGNSIGNLDGSRDMDLSTRVSSMLTTCRSVATSEETISKVVDAIEEHGVNNTRAVITQDIKNNGQITEEGREGILDEYESRDSRRGIRCGNTNRPSA